MLADPKVQEFHRAALPSMIAAGLARCFILTIGTRPAAAYYGFCDRGRAYAYIGGFDPAFVDASPGAILIGHAIALAIGEGGTSFIFSAAASPINTLGGRATGEIGDGSGASAMPPNNRKSRHEMRKILTSCRKGALPPNVALMQLAMAAEAETGFLSEVYAAIDDLGRKSNRLNELRRLMESFPTSGNWSVPSCRASPTRTTPARTWTSTFPDGAPLLTVRPLFQAKLASLSTLWDAPTFWMRRHMTSSRTWKATASSAGDARFSTLAAESAGSRSRSRKKSAVFWAWIFRRGSSTPPANDVLDWRT